ncbi:MAG: DUF1999 domain-containing protein [Meiothermus sp.]
MVCRDIHEPDFPTLEALERELLGPQPAHRYRCTPAALRFFARSGHSFVAQDGPRVVGVVLAQAVWQGDQVTVLITRLLSSSDEATRALLGAVVKSAYDAGVYEVAMHVDPANEPLSRALEDYGFRLGPLLLGVRVLGSRGERGEVAGVLE